MFEKTLTDVVKGIRASKRDTSKYISQCISEIKIELNSSDMFVKANALQKLTFLQMMGFTMNWDRASFATIEVMSSPRFAHKRVGYLAAVRTEYILLCVCAWIDPGAVIFSINNDISFCVVDAFIIQKSKRVKGLHKTQKSYC
jgi:Adaptin N terminal region